MEPTLFLTCYRFGSEVGSFGFLEQSESGEYIPRFGSVVHTLEVAPWTTNRILGRLGVVSVKSRMYIVNVYECVKI